VLSSLSLNELKLAQLVENSISLSVSDSTYEVHSDIGVCTCKAGERGKYCKHMALLVQHLKVQLVCAPPLLSTDRHHLAQLALGEKCPNLTFFLAMTEKPQEEENSGKNILETLIFTSNNNWFFIIAIQSSDLVVDEQNIELEENTTPIEEDRNNNTHESSEELVVKIKSAFDELLGLATADDIAPALLKKVLTAFSKPKSPSAGTASLVAMYRSMSAVTRRGSYIAVNPTGRARRREGVSKGAKRVPMGRPSQAEQQVRGKPKKARNLSQCVNANVANAKTH
jgi:hypothetical protein